MSLEELCRWWVWSRNQGRSKDWLGNGRNSDLSRIVTRNKRERQEERTLSVWIWNYWNGKGKEDCEVHRQIQLEGVGSGGPVSEDLIKGKAPDFSKYNHGIVRFLKLERALEIICGSLFIFRRASEARGRRVTQCRTVVTQSRTVSRLWQKYSNTHIFSHQDISPASLFFLASSLDSLSETLDCGPQPIRSPIRQNEEIKTEFFKRLNLFV